MSLVFSPGSHEQLVELEADGARRQLYERVNDILDLIEDDPSDRSVRLRRYQDPPIWGVTVHGSGEDWLVLWSETDSGGLIHYIGEDLK